MEALGLPDGLENIDEPNERYADQLCNIKAAAHALSIDDNRARAFTPLLLTRKHLLEEQCDSGKVDNVGKISEVWFSGAHADVGGGYDDTHISGISLNWMLDEMEMRGVELIPRSVEVYSDHLSKTHNPETGVFKLIYRERNRDIACYTAVPSNRTGCDKETYRSSTPESAIINVHQSVLDRLCECSPKDHESLWFENEKYAGCLICNDAKRGGAQRR